MEQNGNLGSNDTAPNTREDETKEVSVLHADTKEENGLNSSKTCKENIFNRKTKLSRKDIMNDNEIIILPLKTGDTEDNADSAKEEESENDTYLEALEVEDDSVKKAIGNFIEQSIAEKTSESDNQSEGGTDTLTDETYTHENIDSNTEALDVDLNSVKPEVDSDNLVIVMNKHTKFNARIKPDTSNYRHECSKCSEVFQWPHKLKKHMEIVHKGIYPYHCDVCEKPFDRKSGLTDHMMTHTDERPFECHICQKAFKFKGNLTKHVKEIHLGEVLQFQCEYCDKVFNAKEKLVAHFVVHNDEKQFECKVCGKRFHRKNNLSEHQIIHSSEKKFECPDCGLMFNRKYALKIHSRNHMEVKPYKCELCPASFTQTHALKNHVRRHTGERPYQCSYCDRSFAQQSTLQVHTMRHTGEKNFQCGVCQQSFVIKRRLEEHIRVHTGEKPFQCELCPFRAAISSGLKYHMRTHMRRLVRDEEEESLALMMGVITETVEEVEEKEGVINDGDLRRNRYKRKKKVVIIDGKLKSQKKKKEVINDGELKSGNKKKAGLNDGELKSPKKKKGGLSRNSKVNSGNKIKQSEKGTNTEHGNEDTDTSMGAVLTKIALNAQKPKQKHKGEMPVLSLSNGAITDSFFRTLLLNSSPTLKTDDYFSSPTLNTNSHLTSQTLNTDSHFTSPNLNTDSLFKSPTLNTDGQFRSPTLRAMLLGNSTVNQAANLPVANTFPIDRKLIKESIDKVVEIFNNNEDNVKHIPDSVVEHTDTRYDTTINSASKRMNLPDNEDLECVYDLTAYTAEGVDNTELALDEVDGNSDNVIVID